MSSDPIPKNWIEAVPAVLFGFYGFACAFEAVVAMNAGNGTLAFLDSAGCFILVSLAIIWWKHSDWLPPKLVSTALLFVTDARWLVGAVSLLLIVSALSPFIEQARWPFSHYFVTTVPPASPLVDDQSKQQITVLQLQLANAIRERDAARQQAASAPPLPPTPMPSLVGYDLSPTQIRELAEELYSLKTLLPTIDIQRPLDPQCIGLAQHFSMAFDRGGIHPTVNTNHPFGPKDVGLTIRVGNLNEIPEPAKEIARILKKVIGIEPTFTTLEGLSPDTFIFFIGPNPNG
jgi:hypothetical protein